jgi:hypothetical protein
MSLAPYDPLMGLISPHTAYSDELHHSTVSVHLEVPDSKLHTSLLSYLSNESSKCPITETLSAKAIKVLFSLGGILGKVPLIPVTFSYELENRSLAFLGSSLNFIAFSTQATWAACKMVDKTLYSLKSVEHKQSKSFDRCRKICLLAFNIFNGFTAQIPSLFLTWNYNQDKPYMLGFNALDIAYPAYSLNIMMAGKVSNFAVTARQKKIANLKKDFIEKIESKIKALSRQDCPALIEAFEQMRAYVIPDLTMNRFLEVLQSEHLIGEDPHNPCVEGIKKSASEIISYLLLSVQVFWNAYLTYKATSLKIDNQAFNGAVCLYVVICNIALSRLLLVNATYRLMNSFPGSFRNKSNYFIADRLSPLSSVITKLVILFIASASFMQAAKLSEDFLPSAFVFPSTVTYGLGMAFMHYMPLRSFAHSLTTKLITRFGNDYQKDSLKTHKTLISIKQVFENTSLDSFAIFLLKNELHNMTAYYLHKHEITHDDLTEFLKEPPHFVYDDGFDDYGELERRSLI